MIQTAIRPFTDAEREEVERQLLNSVNDPTPNWWANFGAGVIGAFVGGLCGLAIAYLLIRSGLPMMVTLAMGSVVGFVIGWEKHAQQEQWIAQSRRRQATQLAKRWQCGEVEEVTVSASGVIQIEDCYDGINGYFFDIGDQKVLYLRADILWDAAEEAGPEERDAASFLPSVFRLIRYPDTNDEVLRLEPLGPLLTPLRTISVNGIEEEYYELVDGEVIEGVSLATLESDLPYLSTTENDE